MMYSDLDDFVAWTFMEVDDDVPLIERDCIAEAALTEIQTIYYDEEKGIKPEENKIQNFRETLSEKTQPEVEKKKKMLKTSRKFPCNNCEKVWNWRWELKRHLRSHSRPPTKQEIERNYECTDSTCEKKFRLKNDLKQHMRLHTGDNLSVCGVCQKKFTSKYAKLHHVAVHTGEKPFQCAMCGNQFTQPANLRTHVKNKHSNSTNFTKQKLCKYCGIVLASIANLHQHLLETHNEHVEEERLVASLESVKIEEKQTSSGVFRREVSVIKLNPYIKERRNTDQIDDLEGRRVSGLEMKVWEESVNFARMDDKAELAIPETAK